VIARANLSRKPMMNPTGFRRATVAAAVAVTFAVALAAPQATDAREEGIHRPPGHDVQGVGAEHRIALECGPPFLEDVEIDGCP